MDEEFIAAAFGVVGDMDDAEIVALTFENPVGQNLRVVISRNALSSVLTEIQRELDGEGQAAPMLSNDLQLGRMISIEATQVRANVDGTIQLTLFARLDDRGADVRTLPLTLSPSQASSLASDLQRHASGAPKAS